MSGLSVFMHSFFFGGGGGGSKEPTPGPLWTHIAR